MEPPRLVNGLKMYIKMCHRTVTASSHAWEDIHASSSNKSKTRQKRDSISRIQEQSLARKKKQDVMDSKHLKRLNLITKVADRSSVEPQEKESRGK